MSEGSELLCVPLKSGPCPFGAGQQRLGAVVSPSQAKAQVKEKSACQTRLEHQHPSHTHLKSEGEIAVAHQVFYYCSIAPWLFVAQSSFRCRSRGQEVSGGLSKLCTATG